MKKILTDTEAEEKAAHSGENTAQVDFEDSMQTLTDSEAELKKKIAETEKDIADSRLTKEEKEGLKKEAEEENAAILKYLGDIKPGCDFITANFDQREANRKAESTSLTNAVKLIKGTPAYKTFEEEAAYASKASGRWER